MLAGVLIGAAACRATARRRLRRDDQLYPPASSRHWAAVAAFTALGLVAGLLTVFLPGPQAILRARWLYLFGAICVLAFLGFRFKPSAGVLLSVLVVVAGAAIIGLVSSFRALTGERELATVRALSVEE